MKVKFSFFFFLVKLHLPLICIISNKGRARKMHIGLISIRETAQISGKSSIFVFVRKFTYFKQYNYLDTRNYWICTDI